MYKKNTKIKYSRQKAFSLIELLVTIAVIAIISVVAVAIFNGVTDKARDAQKRAEVEAMAQALETRHTGAAYPNPIQGSWFSGGQLPQPPGGGVYTVNYANDNSNFRVCAALTGNSGVTSTGCSATSATCFCKESSLYNTPIVVTSGVPLTAYFTLTPTLISVPLNSQFDVVVRAQTDTEFANLFSLMLSFDNTKLQFISISRTGTFITQWVEEDGNNPTGEISVVGAYPSPGYKTSGSPVIFSTIRFQAIGTGSTSINYQSLNSGIFQNDPPNNNILNPPSALNLTITP